MRGLFTTARPMASSLLVLLDDIATVLDDVATMTKVAAKKTAGVLGDDLALNAQQVTGVKADRELPVVWAVAWGSLINKAILVPAALAISAFAPWAITPLLMLGGAFLCFEGFEKLAHKFLHSPEEDEAHRAEHVKAVADEKVDMAAYERDKVKGAIKSITDFGIFIGLDGGIDGLVHLSDLSWSVPGEEAVRKYKKGDEVEAIVLGIDVERERISLGIKQLDGDPFTSFMSVHDKNSIVKGTVKSIDAKGAVIGLEGDVEGYLRASEVSRDRVEDIRTHLKEGDAVTAMIINIDRKNRTINLSIKARDMAEESAAMQKMAADKPANAGTTSLGALLKAKLDTANSGQ